MTPVLSAQLSVCYCLLLVGLGSLLFVDAVVCLFVCLHVSEHSDHHLYEYKIYQEWMHKVAPTPITEMCRPCLIIIQSCHHMFSLRDPHFVFCSRDLDVLRARRIMGFFYLNYPQINEISKSDHMVYFDDKAMCKRRFRIS